MRNIFAGHTQSMAPNAFSIQNDLNEGEHVEDIHIIFRFSYIFMYLVQVSPGIQFYIEVTCLL